VTRDDLLKIARTAGIRIIDISSDTNTLTGSLVTFANLIAKIEREECAKIAEPKGPRPCDCKGCYCDNYGDAEKVAQWDADMWTANAIRARGEK